MGWILHFETHDFMDTLFGPNQSAGFHIQCLHQNMSSPQPAGMYGGASGQQVAKFML